MPEKPEEMEGIIVLTDEDGTEHEFELIHMLELEGKRYAILMPVGGGEDDEYEDEDDTVVLRMEADQDGNDILVQIEDDDEWERVVESWEDILDEEAAFPADQEDD